MGIFFLPTIIKFIPLFIALMIFIISTKDRKSKVKTIIFVIIYPFIMIFSSLLLSEFLESKYIITGISLILIYISSLGIHLLIFKNTRLLFLLISAIVPSFIGFLLFSLLWLKYSLGIFLTFIFWIVTITCYILWAFYSVKTSKLDEYFYTAMIFDYGILFGFPYIIILMIDYMERNITFKIFFILLYQYLVIDLIVWIALPIIKKNNKNISFFSLFMILCFFISLLMSFFLLCTLKKGFCKKEGFRKVNLIFYVPIMIIIYIHFSFIIKDDYVLCFILEIFFDLLSITLYIFIWNLDSFTYPLAIILFCSKVVTFIPFYFIFIKDGLVLLYIFLANLGVDIYLYFISRLALDKFNLYDDYLMAIVFIDYIVFCAIYIAFGIAIAWPFIICYCLWASGCRNNN